MWRRASSEVVNETWKLVIDEGLSRAATAKRLGISEQRADRIINALHNRQGALAKKKSVGGTPAGSHFTGGKKIKRL